MAFLRGNSGRVLITGAAGQVGKRVVAAIGASEKATCIAWDRAALDITDARAVESAVDKIRPDVIINCAAMANVDACERDPDAAFAINAAGPGHLAVAAEKVGAHLVHISTDYVFDGSSDTPYEITDETNPIQVYGKSKLAGEEAIAASGGSWSIARTSWVFGAHGEDFVSWIIEGATKGAMRPVINDQWGCPTFAKDLALALIQLGFNRQQGNFHVVNTGSCDRVAQAEFILDSAGLPHDCLRPTRAVDLGRSAGRPAHSVLGTANSQIAGLAPLRHYREALIDRINEESSMAKSPAREA